MPLYASSPHDIDLYIRGLAHASMFQVINGRLYEAHRLVALEALRDTPDSLVLTNIYEDLSRTLLRDFDAAQADRVAVIYDSSDVTVRLFGPRGTVSSRSPLRPGTVLQVGGPLGLLTPKTNRGSWYGSGTLRLPYGPQGLVYLVERPRLWRGDIYIAAVYGTEPFPSWGLQPVTDTAF